MLVSYRVCWFLVLSLALHLSLIAEEIKDIPVEHQLLMEQTHFRILGLGGTCMDLLVPISNEFLSTLPGKKGGAEEITFSELIQIMENNGTIPSLATGGSCANTMKGISSLGEPCALLGKVGAGAWGDFFVSCMEQCGVVPLLHRSKAGSPCVLCLITPDGQRTMRFAEGCSREMTPLYLNPSYLKNVDLVHVEGYGLRNPGLVKRMMELAKEANKIVSFDPSCFELIEEHYELIHELLRNRYIDILFTNSDEVTALTGLPPKEGCAKLSEFCQISVVLLGASGCLVAHKDGMFDSPAFPAEAIDTTGAGDLFASGFLYGYINGASLEQCARNGNLLGHAVVEVVGAEIPQERWEKLRSQVYPLKGMIQ